MRFRYMSAATFAVLGDDIELGDVVEILEEDGSHTRWVLLWRVPGREPGWVQCPRWPQPLSVVLGSGSHA